MPDVPLYELAIRRPKKGRVLEDFIRKKNEAVAALVRIPGVGPEREFAPFAVMPPSDGPVFVGMTRYASKGRITRAMLSPRFGLRLMRFMGAMDPMLGVFLRPAGADFDYAGFATRSTVTEFAALRPAPGVDRSAFLRARKEFLTVLDRQPEVVKSWEMDVTGGFVGTDAFVHITSYKSKEAFDALTARIRNESFWTSFAPTFTPACICFCTTVK